MVKGLFMAENGDGDVMMLTPIFQFLEFSNIRYMVNLDGFV